MIQTSLLMDHKIEQALMRIREFCPPEGYYVAFSGGKDSIVVLDLVRKAGVKHDTHWNITTVDPPELVKFVKQNYPDVIREIPPETMWQIIERKMIPPTRMVRYCCEILKERNGEGRLIITGIRWAESSKRSQRKLVESCTRGGTKRFVNPIIDWSDQEVWEYIKSNELKYPSLYDEGFKRLGCIGCPMSSNREKEFKRWPGTEARYKKAIYAAAAHRREVGFKRQGNHPLNFNSGEEMWEWWMMDRSHGKENEAQCVLFE